MSRLRFGVLSTADSGLKKVIPAMLKAERAAVVAIASRDEARARQAAAACVRVRTIVEPDLEWQRVYDHEYGRFRSLYPALKPLEAP
jgi:predicted dehydrogenase